MKWFGGIVTSLVIAGLSAIILAYLQPILRAIAPDEVIDAKFELSHWQEKPLKDGDSSNKINQKEGNDIPTRVPNVDGLYDFMTIKLENNTSKVVDNIRIRFKDFPIFDAKIIGDDGIIAQTVLGSNDFKIPNMKPGDREIIFVWGKSQFISSALLNNVQTFSSSGPFRISFYQPEENMITLQDEGPFFKFIDEWIGFIIGAIFVALILVLGAALSAQEEYLKKIFRDEQFMIDEKARFDANPKKFSPKLTG
ncbi:hypothetical protein [Novosphingobium sp.]|uniref:hypothetical protein n=1 Tax=Novosphingobium sp. TaxID=1874826 RepID=UPI001DD31CB2|nr:hypothetical protein [Novosphingobium sp.]MBX9665384.1 hypothetical protein [Novosphingobium sp.]